MINVQVDIKDVTAYLRGMERQMQFALVKALNKTANDAQSAVRKGIEQRFVLRKKEFILRTVKIPKEARADTRSNKYDVDVMIDPQKDVLAKFEAGGEKRAIDGKAIAIPTTAIRPTITATIPLARRPPRLFASKRGLAGRIYSKRGFLFETIGRGRAAITRALYVWKDAVRIKPMLHFVATVEESVSKTWKPNAEAAVQYEIDTFKGPRS